MPLASLDIRHIEGNNYLFTAKGCHLEYFVIWAEGDEPRWEKVYESYELSYQLEYELESDTTYNFHVYDSNGPEGYRGMMTYTTKSDNYY